MKFGRRRAAQASEDVRSRSTARVAAHEAPGHPSAGQEDRTAAVENAIVSINDSILKLTAELERIDRLVAAKPASADPADPAE